MAVADSVERYAERFPGWRRSSSGYCCPRQVVGKRCLRFHRDGCICELRLGLIDHQRLWIAPDGEHVMTSEPYHIDPDDLEDLQRGLAGIGAEVVVEDYSPYYPGSTRLLIIRKTAQ